MSGSSARTWTVVLLAITAFLILAFVFASRFGSDPTLVASPLIGQPAPGLEMPLLEADDSLSLDEHAGDIVVVNFWASWCLGCRQEHDALLAAAEAYEEFGVEFVGVLYQDSPARGIGFLDEFGRSDRFAYTFDGESRTALEFGVLGLPETFFVDRDGTIVGKVNGPLNYQLLTDTLDTMLVGGAIESVTTGEVQQAPTN